MAQRVGQGGRAVSRNWLYLIPLGGFAVVMMLAYGEQMQDHLSHWLRNAVIALYAIFLLAASAIYAAGSWLRAAERRYHLMIERVNGA